MRKEELSPISQHRNIRGICWLEVLRQKVLNAESQCPEKRVNKIAVELEIDMEDTYLVSDEDSGDTVAKKLEISSSEDSR